MKLRGELIPVRQISAVERCAMYALMDRYYENVDSDHFSADLSEKQWVIRLSDPATGALCGFSTQMVMRIDGVRGPARVLFSGDTIIDHEHWGDAALSHVWGNLTLSLMDQAEAAGEEMYWFLICKGYKTYRFLPVFFREFYPRHDRPTPPWAADLIGRIGQRKCPDAFEAATGIIRADAGKDRLRAGVADLTPQRLRDPHVAFFAQRNPAHARGDELCCIAPLTRENYAPAAWRVIRAGEPAAATP